MELYIKSIKINWKWLGNGIQAIARCDGDQDGQLELFVASMEDPAAAVD